MLHWYILICNILLEIFNIFFLYYVKSRKKNYNRLKIILYLFKQSLIDYNIPSALTYY